MVMLAHVQFTNDTGGPATVYYKVQGHFAGNTQDIAGGATGAAIDGTLLTIDFQNEVARLRGCEALRQTRRSCPSGAPRNLVTTKPRPAVKVVEVEQLADGDMPPQKARRPFGELFGHVHRHARNAASAHACRVLAADVRRIGQVGRGDGVTAAERVQQSVGRIVAVCRPVCLLHGASRSVKIRTSGRATRVTDIYVGGHPPRFTARLTPRRRCAASLPVGEAAYRCRFHRSR
jgi:hypothetical protein